MIFGPSGRVHDSQNQLFFTLDTPQYFKNYKKIRIMLTRMILVNRIIFEIVTVGKDACRIILKIRLIYS